MTAKKLCRKVCEQKINVFFARQFYRQMGGWKQICFHFAFFLNDSSNKINRLSNLENTGLKVVCSNFEALSGTAFYCNRALYELKFLFFYFNSFQYAICLHNVQFSQIKNFEMNKMKPKILENSRKTFNIPWGEKNYK